jgi:hypothetical protein
LLLLWLLLLSLWKRVNPRLLVLGGANSALLLSLASVYLRKKFIFFVRGELIPSREEEVGKEGEDGVEEEEGECGGEECAGGVGIEEEEREREGTSRGGVEGGVE